MLDLMRRKKWLKAILWLVIIGLGITMALFFVPGQGVIDSGLGSSVATVDGDPISVTEYVKTYRRFVDSFSAGGRNKVDRDTLKAIGLPRQALDALISVRVVEYAALKLGLDVSPEEIRRAIESNPNLQDRGVFIGVERYKAVLAANNLDVAEFEEGVRSMLLGEKVRRIVSDSLTVSDKELREEYVRANQEAQARFVILKKDDFRKKVAPTEAELRTYFEANKQKFAVKEQRRSQYLLLGIAALADTISVSEDDLREQWQKENRQETVDASHILLELKDPAKEAEVKAQAEALLKRAKAGEDFAELAKKHSQDPGSAQQGGNLGPFPRGQMAKEFEDAAFAAKPGEILGPVRTPFGFHIIKVLRHEIPDFESSRKALERSIQLDRASELAKEKAAEAQRLVAQEKDLAKIVASIGVAADIKETPFLAKDSDPFANGISGPLLEEIFRLKEINAVGNPTEMPVGYAIPKLIETRLPRPTEFVEAKSAVEKDYIDLKAGELLQAAAKSLAADARQLGDLEKAAQKEKLTFKTSLSFKRDATPDPEIGTAPQFNSAAFDLPIGGISDPVSLEGGARVVVLQVSSRTPFDEGGYAQQKAELRDRLLSMRRDDYFQEYIRKVTESLEKAGKIRMNGAAIEQVTGVPIA